MTNKIAKTPPKLTPYTEITLRALSDGAARHGHLIDFDLSLPNLALLVASALTCSFLAALKRLHRLTQNERFDPERLLIRRFQRLGEQTGSKHGHTLILVDWTSCGAFDLLVAAVALGDDEEHLGRAMLLYAEAHRKDRLSRRKNKIEQQFLTSIKRALQHAADETGADHLALDQFVFVFDRGFAKDRLFRFLGSEGFRFIVRANTNVRCRSPKGRTMLLSKYVRRLRSGSIVRRVVYKHRAEGHRPVMNLVVRRRRVGKKWAEWYLWTNLEDAELVARAYERRFSIEESFKDAKTHWKIEQRRIQYADRFCRYLAILALLQAELCRVALTLLAAGPEIRRRLGESGRNRLSIQNLVRRAAFLEPEMLSGLPPSQRCL